MLMYAQSTLAVPVLGGTTALAYTGLSVNLVWLLCAAFALLAVGGALMRMVPSLHATPSLAGHGTPRPLTTVRLRSARD